MKQSNLDKQGLTAILKQGIKGPDIMVNLVWVNTYISEYLMHNSVGIVVGQGHKNAVTHSHCVIKNLQCTNVFSLFFFSFHTLYAYKCCVWQRLCAPLIFSACY